MREAWGGASNEVPHAVAEQCHRLRETYVADPSRVEQDANIERSIAEGAYARRQLFELVQNAADAMRSDQGGGRCEVLLTDGTLYVANSGCPLSVLGVQTLMATHKSAKRDDQIGRFGLGFKSTLAVSDSPMILSRSGSLTFDRQRSEEELSQLVPGCAAYPASRLAWAVDPNHARERDGTLASLMLWATTVVVLPLKTDREELARSIRNFPAEFLLFSPHVKRLDVEDRPAGIGRTITLSTDESGAYILDDAGRCATWVVKTIRHDPSPAALADGGYHAARETLEASWAAPLEGAIKGVGTFWAYFPTNSGTTLSGIINAPWKLAEDRESLLPGVFNSEILVNLLPRIVSEALPLLFRSSKPLAVLDALPARGKEARNYADDILNDPVMRLVADGPCIPTQGGTLQPARKTRLHPEGLVDDELTLWAWACPDPISWVHHSVASAEHRSKVVRLLGYHDRRAATLKEWVEHLVKKPTVEGSAAAVQLVASLWERCPAAREELVNARVLLLSDGTLHACRKGQVFLPGGSTPEGSLTIDEVLASDPQVVSSLHRLGIEIFDAAGELLSELTRDPIKWDRVWISSRKNPPEESEHIFRETLGNELLRLLRVRTYAGNWRSPSMVYLPGEVIPSNGARDSGFVVDHRYHQQDLDLLGRLGLVDAPARFPKDSVPLEAWRSSQLASAREAYRRQKGPARLEDERIIVDEEAVPWPLDPVQHLSLEGRAAATEAILRRMSGEEHWRLTRTDGRAAAVAVQEGVWLHLRRYGALPTQVGVQPVSGCLRWDPDGAHQDGEAQPLPFVGPTVSNAQSDVLGLKEDPADLRPESWVQLMDDANGWEEGRRFLLYAWAAYYEQPAPPRIKVVRGYGHVVVAPAEVAVTQDRETHRSLVEARVPSIWLPLEDDVERLRDQWGLTRGEDMLVESLDVDEAGEPVLAVDRFPPLRNYLDEPWEDMVIHPCSRVELRTATPVGAQTRPLTVRLEGKKLYTTALEDHTVLRQIAKVVDGSFTAERILQAVQEQRRNKLRQSILEEKDLATKVLMAVGVESLYSKIPAAAIDALTDDSGSILADHEVARLALAVNGYGVLQAHSKALVARQLDPPASWAGRRPAREWVRGLGFPVEFAGFSGETRAAEIEVEGPAVLGELHDYQAEIARRVRALIADDTEIQRGLLSLPTGAGKTRVAVQALVEHMGEHDKYVRVVWLAETDELCEQATQTWAHVWRAKGRPGQSMTLSRLWRGNRPNERDGHQVVVASLSTLLSIVRENDGSLGDYEWLKQPSIIVVDEAHRSISPKYTETISALGGTKRVVDIRTPLLGLTATPFRGFNEQETEGLVNRYHKNLLDSGIFVGDDVYSYLQEKRVLARVRHLELEGGQIALRPDEMTLAEMGMLPRGAEKRLGQDKERNSRILTAALELERDQSALVFATSVENAEVLAALLTHHGVEARAISGDSDAFARRRYVQDFREKKIRVLTNYNVFTEGFDVPKIDAVFITRPTFSPNVYQQMIGRGLRGPLNGGNEEVLIVNVADNITNFGKVLAFRHFDYLWNKG